jgi:hypothetical protein
LNVLRGRLLTAACAADVGTHYSTADCAANGSDFLAAAAADLVTQNAADNGADNGAGNGVAAAFLRHLLALNPAALS